MTTKAATFRNQPSGGAATIANSDDYGDDALNFASIAGAMTVSYWQGSAGTSALKFDGGEDTTATASFGYSGWASNQLNESIGIYLTALPTTSGVQVLQFRTAAGNLVGVTLLTNGKVNIATAGALNGVFSWTSTAVLAINTWYRIDMAALIDSVSGKIDAAIAAWASASALTGGAKTSDPINTGTTQLAQVRFGKLTSGGSLPTFFIRNPRITDETLTLMGPYVETNHAPVVSAGADQTVTIGTTATLNGTATDDDGTIASVLWEVVSTPGASITLSSTTVNSPTFPTTGKPPGDYVLQFTATDDDGASTSAITTVTLQDVTAPTANAFADSGYALVDASGSTGSGALTFAISPTANTTSLGGGKFLVKQGTSAVDYTITVSSSAGSSTKTVTVPAQTAAGGTYTGDPITIQLPVPLDQATLDRWGNDLNDKAFDPITVGLNDVIRFLNGTA